MPENRAGGNGLTERVNQLYWSGPDTVEQIADRLGVSRTTLYANLEAQPSGLFCADCHERMVFANRTARDRGVAVCPTCGRESEPGEAGPAETGERARPAAEAGEGLPATIQRLGVALREVPAQRVALVGGGAALGVVLGALLTGLARGPR